MQNFLLFFILLFGSFSSGTSKKEKIRDMEAELCMTKSALNQFETREKEMRDLFKNSPSGKDAIQAFSESAAKERTKLQELQLKYTSTTKKPYDLEQCISAETVAFKNTEAPTHGEWRKDYLQMPPPALLQNYCVLSSQLESMEQTKRGMASMGELGPKVKEAVTELDSQFHETRDQLKLSQELYLKTTGSPLSSEDCK